MALRASQKSKFKIQKSKVVLLLGLCPPDPPIMGGTKSSSPPVLGDLGVYADLKQPCN